MSCFDKLSMTLNVLRYNLLKFLKNSLQIARDLIYKNVLLLERKSKTKREKQVKMLRINLENIAVDVLQKNIRNIHLRIYPPFGEVRISAPKRMSLEKIHNFIKTKIDWIREKQNKILATKYEIPKQYKSGEEHNFFGQKYLLEVVEENKKPNVKIVDGTLILKVREKATKKQREKVLQDFYRIELKKIAATMIKKWQVEMKVEVREFGVKKMKTRWGTCNVRAHRIWLNLELAKLPIECLEHIVVHEMVHLLERKHSKRFFALMDNFLPHWRESKAKLKMFSC